MLKRSRTAVVVLALLASLGLAGCGGDDETATDAGSGPACDYPEGRPASKEVDLPPARATVSGDVELTMTTSAGEIGLELDADAAPCTVGSFVSLAEQGYFDDTSCHRLTVAPASIFVLQCGDPEGTGGGGPGYTFDDELTGDETYPAGTIAMANAGEDTNGSQFFIVYDDTPLPPAYAVFGTVDESGLQVVRDVASAGTATGAPDGPPKTPVDIESVVVDD